MKINEKEFNFIPRDRYSKQLDIAEANKIENEEVKLLLQLVCDKCFISLNQDIEMLIKDEDQLAFIERELAPYKLLIELALRKIEVVNNELDKLVDDMYEARVFCNENFYNEMVEVEEIDL